MTSRLSLHLSDKPTGDRTRELALGSGVLLHFDPLPLWRDTEGKLSRTSHPGCACEETPPSFSSCSLHFLQKSLTIPYLGVYTGMPPVHPGILVPE